MRCPQCDYELPRTQFDCPCCRFREAVRRLTVRDTARAVAAPVPETADSDGTPAAVEVPGPAEVPITMGQPAARPAPAPWKKATAWAVGVPLILIAGWLATAAIRNPTKAKIGAIFMAADGPCRAGIQSPCFDSIRRIRVLRDYPDASLLLGDYKVARYLRTVPGSRVLTKRWQEDEITEPELLAMGNATYVKNLSVCRSFWMYAQIKRDHVAVPQFIIGGAAP